MKFNINNYKGNCAMHCKTRAEAESFCRYLDIIGKTWSDGTGYLENNRWNFYTDQTCYNFNEGLYCRKSFYEANGYKILEFSDFDWSEMTPKHIFKVGDRIRCINGLGYYNPNVTGKVGTIIDIHGRFLLIEFDEYVNGHNGLYDVKGKDGYCWWLLEDKLEFINTNTKRKPVIIYQNGQEVVALDKETGKKAVAKCHPNDTFDFAIGAKLAFERLYHKFKLGDRVRCVKSYQGNNKIVGKTGKVIYDSGTHLLVEFDEYVDGHDGDWGEVRGKDGYCWWLPNNTSDYSAGYLESVKC